MMHMCEGCHVRTELTYVRRVDEYLCPECEEIAVQEVFCAAELEAAES